MKALDRQFTKIVNGSTQFVIPVFQRDYGWSEAQCTQLWNDVVRIGKSKGDRGHFVGSLVYIPSGDTAAGFTRWLLIDGQQRMTTMTLLLIALRRHILTTGWSSSNEDGPTAKRIEAYFLKNIQEEGERQYKLILRRRDQLALRALLDDTTMPKEASLRIQENFDFFCEQIKDESPDTVYAGIGKLIVVDVALDRVSDDPQMIFESLNSTGLDLSQADLIRNFILMRVPEPLQTKLYESLWHPIEELFSGAGRTFDAFARDYMALERRAKKQTRSEDIYREFRTFFQEREATLELEPALAEMLRFARYYAAFALRRECPLELAPALTRLDRLAEAATLLMMRLFDCHKRLETLSMPEFIQAIELIESYVFRRSVCGMQTRGYWQIFAAIAERLNEQQPLRSLASLLHRQRESYRFPNDQEFAEELRRRDMYNTRTCHYMLDRFENHGNKEPTDTGGYTVEHILPQNPNLLKEWKEMLGDTWQTTQKTWLHRLGNLTLTGYNSSYSDRSFGDKKTIPGGFEESSVRLNRFVREQSTWTQAQIEERGAALAERALRIWPPLKVTDGAVRESIQEELRQLALKGTVEALPITDEIRPLFDSIRSQIRALDPAVIEIARTKSVSYHAADGDFFVELLPRKHTVVVLINLDLSECEHRDDELRDATEYKWLANAANAGGVFYSLGDPTNLDTVVKLVKQAHGLAAQ